MFSKPIRIDAPDSLPHIDPYGGSSAGHRFAQAASISFFPVVEPNGSPLPAYEALSRPEIDPYG